MLVDNTQVIEQQLLKSELDAAIVEGSISSPDLVTQCMMNDPLALVCAAHHNPFGERRCVSMAELQRVPFILREKGSGTREVFERAMPHINAQWVCNNSEAILHGVEQGFGMTVISRRLAEQRLASGSLIELCVTDMSLERQFSVVWHKNKYKSNSLQQFIDISTQYGLEQERT